MNGVKDEAQRLGMRAEERSWRRRFRCNFSISLIGSGLTLAIKLGQTALLTKLLRIDDYGRLLIVLNLFVFIETFIGLRVSDLVFRFFRPMQEGQDEDALRGLLLLCFGISLATGLAIFGGVLAVSARLAEHLYRAPELAPLFNVYGCTVLVTALSGVYEPLLRIHNRFASIVVPQVVGSLATLVMLAAYFASTDAYNLKFIVAAFAVGILIQTLPPLAHALRLMMPTLAGFNAKQTTRALAKYRRQITGCLFHSNLSGYLKFAITPGDLFILGLVSTPSQVALYGLARQLTAPLAILQTNIQTAVSPELASLVARGQFAPLKRFVASYTALSLLFCGLLSACALLLGRPLILWLARPDYIAAAPVFYTMLGAASLMLALLLFRPLALSLDMLRWHNLAPLSSTVVLFVFVFTGQLNALTLACIQLAEALILRPLFNTPVWLRLRALASNSLKRDAQ